MLGINAKCSSCGLFWADAKTSKSILSGPFNADGISVVEFTCPNCGSPIPVNICRNETGDDFTAILPRGFGDVGLSKDDSTDDPAEFDIGAYLNEVVSNQPNEVFQFAFDDVDWILMNVNHVARDNPTFIRMIFTQLFAIFETYLADRLIRLVEENDDALRSLVFAHSSWGNSSISFRDAFTAVQVVRNKVIEELALILYHNFAKVHPIYKAVFGTGIFASDHDRELLFKYEQIRHDCVHRNGRTKAGDEHELSHDDINALAVAIRNSHDLIEEAYARRY